MPERGLADYLDEMTQTDGWQAVMEWVNGRVDNLANSLLTCPVADLTPEFVRETRIKIDTYKSVQRFVESTIEDGREEALVKPPP